MLKLFSSKEVVFFLEGVFFPLALQELVLKFLDLKESALRLE